MMIFKNKFGGILLPLCYFGAFFLSCKPDTTTIPGDTDIPFWESGKIDHYLGNQILLDSALVSVDSLGHSIWEFRSADTTTWNYWVKKS